VTEHVDIITLYVP